MGDGDRAEERARTRRLWHLLETVHAITYFAPETAAALRALGMRGFWMGYFAARVAPMGPVGPEVAAAVVFGFRPSMVARALPSAWALTTPDAVVKARAEAVEGALTRLTDRAPEALGAGEAAELAETAREGCSSAGRPLFAAHTTLPRPSSGLGRLWRAATLLREHRGDGHVAASVTHGLDGLDSHVLMAATGAVTRATLQPNRGWLDEEWEAAEQSLGQRGWVDAGRLTDAGQHRRQAVEDATDDLAAAPWRHLGAEASERLALLLAPLAAAVRRSGTIPFPNPMGLPAEGGEGPR